MVALVYLFNAVIIKKVEQIGIDFTITNVGNFTVLIYRIKTFQVIV